MIKKVLVGIAVFLLLCVGGGAAFVSFGLPDVSEAPDIKIERTGERVKQGRYLAQHVTVCMDCHSTRNPNLFSQPIDTSLLGGGYMKPFKVEGTGRFYASNLTPYNLKDWTDGELYRAITSGVDKNGDPLFPIMPYQHYATMDREDIYSIIAYLRTLEPVQQDVPDSQVEFPMNLIMKTIPQDPTPKPKPAKTDTIAYGKYLVNAASCSSCHTPKDAQGQPLPGMNFAGGFEFPMPTGGVAHSANITPDKETGIGNWTEEKFVARFRSYQDGIYRVKENEFNTEMPWSAYANMREDDLKAIYAYLQTISPVVNKIEKFTSN